MNTYIVQVDNPQVLDTLRTLFEKVGNPSTIPDIVVVKTTKPRSALLAVKGVLSADLDRQSTLGPRFDMPSVDRPLDTISKATNSSKSREVVDISQVVQNNPPGWGLSWISNTNGTYENAKSGLGVDIYILDTGIRDTHSDFTGRVQQLYSHDGLSYDPADPVSPNHGTNVAGCAAGTRYGTAKLATIINCRTNFWNSDIIIALDVILKHHLNKPFNRQSVLNFSGSSEMSVIGTAFQRLAMYGVVIVAAAGNYSEDRPRYPAASWYVEGVGALNQQEGRAYFSNGGVSPWAPGQDITTAGVTSDTAEQMTSGTSFSSPYYAGLLACQLEGSDKFNTMPLCTNFWYYSRTVACDGNRIPYFPNVDGQARTVTTRNQNGSNAQYYTAPSAVYSDQDILDFLLAHYETNTRIIVQSINDGNVDLAQLVQVTGYAAWELNQYFIDRMLNEPNPVYPWWFEGATPVIGGTLLSQTASQTLRL